MYYIDIIFPENCEQNYIHTIKFIGIGMCFQ